MDESYSVIRTEIVSADGTVKPGEQKVLSEHKLSVYINQVLFRELVCTDDRLTELVLGNLYTVGVLRDREALPEITFSKDRDRADLTLESVDGSFRQKEPERLPEAALDIRKVFRLISRFEEGMPLHRATKGTHSSILMVDGEIVFAAEDIGRHNALDKAVGYMLLKHFQPEKCMLYTSGRVPTDMVEKVIAAGIPVLVAKAIPTMESAWLAQKYGLILIIRAWPDQFEIVK